MRGRLGVSVRRLHHSPVSHRLYPWPAARSLADARARWRWQHDPNSRSEAIRSIRYLLGRLDGYDVEAVAFAHLRLWLRYFERRWRPWLTDHQPVDGVATLHRLVGCGGVLLNFMHHGEYHSVFPSLNRAGVTGIYVPAHRDHYQVGTPVHMRQDLAIVTSAGGTRLVEATGSYQQLRDLLAARSTVALACDLPGRTVTTVLGRRVRASSGAARLALDTGALIVPVTARPHGDGQRLAVQEPIDPVEFTSPDLLLTEIWRRHEPALLAWPEAVNTPLSRWSPVDPEDVEEFGACD